MLRRVSLTLLVSPSRTCPEAHNRISSRPLLLQEAWRVARDQWPGRERHSYRLVYIWLRRDPQADDRESVLSPVRIEFHSWIALSSVISRLSPTSTTVSRPWQTVSWNSQAPSLPAKCKPKYLMPWTLSASAESRSSPMRSE